MPRRSAVTVAQEPTAERSEIILLAAPPKQQGNLPSSEIARAIATLEEIKRRDIHFDGGEVTSVESVHPLLQPLATHLKLPAMIPPTASISLERLARDLSIKPSAVIAELARIKDTPEVSSLHNITQSSPLFREVRNAFLEHIESIGRVRVGRGPRLTIAPAEIAGLGAPLESRFVTGLYVAHCYTFTMNTVSHAIIEPPQLA